MNRILFISRAYGENAGGMERLSYELISECKKHSFLNVSEIVHETKPGRSLMGTRLASIAYIVAVLPQALRSTAQADIVHIGDPVLSLVGWCIMHFKKKPVVVTVHGLDVSYSNQLYRLYLRLFFRSLSAYIPISNYAKTLLETHGVSGLVRVIPPGIIDNLYDPTKTRQDLGKLLQRDISNTTVLATTGRLVKRKGHAWFIAHVLTNLPSDFIYVIAGSGPEENHIRHMVQSLGFTNRVYMLGRVSQDDQRTLLNTIDAFIQPNIQVKNEGEGFGIAPLEAAVCGRNVFASNIDGISSAIHDGKNGVLLEPESANAWIRTLTAFVPEKTQGREYSLREFNWGAVMIEYEQVFKEVQALPSP